MTLIAVAARKAEVLIATIAVTMVKRAYYNLNHHIHHNPDLASHPANGYRNISFLQISPTFMCYTPYTILYLLTAAAGGAACRFRPIYYPQ